MRGLIGWLAITMMFSSALSCATSQSEKLRWQKQQDAWVWIDETPAAELEQEALPELDEQATLDHYLAYAALNNPGLEAAFSRWKAALEKIPQVTALPDPRFTYAYYIQEVETRAGPQHQSFSLAQTFPWFGKLELRGDAATEAARAEKERYEAAKLKLFFQVKDAYYEYYYLSQAIAVVQENLDLVQYLESVARTRYASAIAMYADVVRAQVELGKLEDQLRTLQDLREPIVAKLNAAMNRPPNAPLPWPQTIEQPPASFTEDELLLWLKEYNPDLRAVEFLAAREKWNIDLAKKSYFPDFTFGLLGIDTSQALNPATPDSGKDAIIATVSINVPVWWNKYRAEVREAQSRYNGFLNERIDLENRLTADLKLVGYRYRDAERKIDLYRDALVPKAIQSLEVTLRSYEAGEGTFLDLIDSERALLEFQLAFERAFADRAQRLAELEMLLGRKIPRAAALENDRVPSEPLPD